MIPKIIHYCWFGGSKLPSSAIKCIKSWKRFCPDYEIKEWNETNFDINMYSYTREAYNNKKYAFVSDVVRLYALFNYGGIYMDTDVEIIKPLDGLLSHEAFCGFEKDDSICTAVIGSERNGIWIKEILTSYAKRHFIKEDLTMDFTPNVVEITRYMKSVGIVLNNTFQEIPNLVAIYPKDFFSPLVYETRELLLTNQTLTIHHFAGSWLPLRNRLKDRHLFLYRIIYFIPNHKDRFLLWWKKMLWK